MRSFKRFLNESLTSTSEIEGFLRSVAGIHNEIRTTTRLDSPEELNLYHAVSREYGYLADYLQDHDDPRTELVRNQIIRSQHPTSNIYSHVQRELGVNLNGYSRAFDTAAIKGDRFAINVEVWTPKKDQTLTPVICVNWTVVVVANNYHDSLTMDKSFLAPQGIEFLKTIGTPGDKIDAINKVIQKP